ncbi:tRNA-dihydrouridine synthase 3 [Polytolypa hystricis UAMH7299]|uniref:tRNA-dihydrouridine(47) synthase [NAD(P)(+)] n=1 Tax=Polytolypa hystricis (strain UAMH7299) TaxID=1447883 RepID=A0A2B7Z434_POLH7|nr:tRNA-dihydrouridine synthase 3 [Polytolypa hystricis UAMH7299]
MEPTPPNNITEIANGHPPAEIVDGQSNDNLPHKNDPERSADFQESPAKRIKLDSSDVSGGQPTPAPRIKGVAPIKAEYLVSLSGQSKAPETKDIRDDDEAEAARYNEPSGDKPGKRREKGGGQNIARKFGRARDEKQLCQTITLKPEFSPDPCSYGKACKFEHDLRKYLKEYKREDLKTLNGVCPVWEEFGVCSAGWKCRLVGSHMAERETEDGRKELVLVEDESRKRNKTAMPSIGADGAANTVSTQDKIALGKRRYKTPKSVAYTDWLNDVSNQLAKTLHGRASDETVEKPSEEKPSEGKPASHTEDAIAENRAQYKEPPFLPSEKRRIYFGPETPVLAPLTTQGNLPFRRLCVEMGCQLTYSEMAMSLSLIQGNKSEWALMKAHESEILPPSANPKQTIVQDYDNARDLKFGAQIAANKPWQALKATEALTALCPNLRVVDLNCGCPIDLVYRDGAGSALLDHGSKMEKILRGMNAVSGEVPITAKIRMGTKDNSPTALKLAERLLLGGLESREIGQGPPGVAAITLHGRSRQQRYSRQADWKYISECAALIKRLNEQNDKLTDTVREPEAQRLPAAGKVFFLGNGDCYSHEDYNRAITESGVDAVMIGRGALMKPWIFEEIEKGQYLDKSATERLAMLEKFAKYGLQAWGSDEYGVGTTRRFMLELLSFTYRYIPVGLLEYLPPSMQDRPPAWKGRNELETLLGSDNCKDWVKITEMFLGPAHKGFNFEPKHKSNSYDIVAEG